MPEPNMSSPAVVAKEVPGSEKIFQPQAVGRIVAGEAKMTGAPLDTSLPNILTDAAAAQRQTSLLLPSSQRLTSP